MAISSPGIGSGLDVNSIVSQLVALEKKPLEQLQTTASSLQTKLSAFGQLKSQLANLQDQAAKLANTTTWGALALTSSNSAVAGTLRTGATGTQFSVQVSQLATAQAAAGSPVAAGTKLGSGTLSISLGSWTGVDHDNDSDTPDLQQFGQKAGSTSVNVSIAATDTLAQVAQKINAAGAGVSAAVVTDANGERLAIRSTETGSTNGFRIQVGNLGSGSTLDALTFDPENTASGMTLTESGSNTLARINGVDVESTDNRFNGVVAGVNLTVSAVTTSPVNVAVTQDKASIRTAINNLAESYNALSNALKEMTKYDPATKVAGSLQGDSTAVGLQSALRRIFSGLGPADSSVKRLSDVGLEFQSDGTLKVNAGKVNQALDNYDDLKTFFTAGGEDGANGMAVRIRNFAQGMVDASGTLTGRNNALKAAIDRNTKDQERLTERVERTESRLLAQYSRLDTQLASLTALSSYVAQQVTTWNNQKSD